MYLLFQASKFIYNYAFESTCKLSPYFPVSLYSSPIMLFGTSTCIRLSGQRELIISQNIFKPHSKLMVHRVDLCHQSHDDDDEDEGYYSSQEALLEKMNKTDSKSFSCRRCCNFRSISTGSRQKFVILVWENS